MCFRLPVEECKAKFRIADHYRCGNIVEHRLEQGRLFFQPFFRFLAIGQCGFQFRDLVVQGCRRLADGLVQFIAFVLVEQRDGRLTGKPGCR